MLKLVLAAGLRFRRTWIISVPNAEPTPFRWSQLSAAASLAPRAPSCVPGAQSYELTREVAETVSHAGQGWAPSASSAFPS